MDIELSSIMDTQDMSKEQLGENDTSWIKTELNIENALIRDMLILGEHYDSKYYRFNCIIFSKGAVVQHTLYFHIYS